MVFESKFKALTSPTLLSINQSKEWRMAKYNDTEKDDLMSIVDDLIATLPSEPIPVRDVCIGVFWTAVSSAPAHGVHLHGQIRSW